MIFFLKFRFFIVSAVLTFLIGFIETRVAMANWKGYDDDGRMLSFLYVYFGFVHLIYEVTLLSLSIPLLWLLFFRKQLASNLVKNIHLTLIFNAILLVLIELVFHAYDIKQFFRK